MLRDLRYAIRMLMKSPGFSAIAILTLALGICGVTTQFSVIDAALLRGLPFDQPDQLVRVAMRDPSWAADRDRNLILSDLMDLRPIQKSFTDLAAYYTAGSFILTNSDEPQRLNGSHVTPGFFSILGARPAMGRDFLDADHQPGVPRVTIISDALWKSDFGSDPNVVGRKIRVNGQVAEIVGVMPPGFAFTRDLLWMPMFNEFPMLPRSSTLQNSASVLARLKPGVSIEQAAAELDVFLQNRAKAYPQTNGAYTAARVDPMVALRSE